MKYRFIKKLNKINYNILIIKNVIISLYWKIIIFFGYKRSDKHIPPGFYCYVPDDDKNKLVEDFSTFYIKPCIYYKNLGKGYNSCTYLGVITDDMIFDDQCKICGKNKY